MRGFNAIVHSTLCLALLSRGCVGAPRQLAVSGELTVVSQPRRSLRSVSLGTSLGSVTPRVIAAVTQGRGAWVNSPEYGAVWLPAAPSGFVPYLTHGGWTVTDAGWLWQSTLPWGDLTFHHGRWIAWGGRWAWVPGTQFAPAWVDWRVGQEWLGWAPQAPRGAVSNAPFVYCAPRDVLSPQLARVAVTGAAASSLYPSTHAVPARRGYLGAEYSPGPSAALVGVAVTPLQAVQPSAAEELAAMPLDRVALDEVSPPDDVPELPSVLWDARESERAGDLRVPVRIRTEDLTREAGARVSVINVPPRERAELFRRRPVAVAVAPSRTPEAEPDALPPLPPPADRPLAWWPAGARRGAPRGGVGATGAVIPSRPLEPPTAPLVGMSAPPPPSAPIAVNAGAAIGRGIAVAPSSGSFSAQPLSLSR